MFRLLNKCDCPFSLQLSFTYVVTKATEITDKYDIYDDNNVETKATLWVRDNSVYVTMNSSVKTFLSILILGLFGAGIYFGTLKLLVVFQDDEKVSLKKQIPVKPKNIKEKQALVESGSSNDEEFTFFDTLSDPSMSKFVGLNGSVADPAQVANDTPPGPTDPTSARGDVETISQAKNSDSENLLNPVAEKSETVKVEVGKQVESVASGFALQVGSFRQLERAGLLKEKLVKKGYPVFVATVRIAGKDEVWHRVFIGRFLDRETAVVTARKAKQAEKLDSVLMWQESPS